MRLWRELSGEQQRAAAAASALFLALLLPWYSHPLATRDGVIDSSVNAFGVFSFVEAAVLVVAVAVLYLLYARAQRRGFHLPGGDGWAVTIAGAWVLFLLIWRLFDKPDFRPGPVGVEWGLFVAMAVAAALAASGQRMRAEHKPEPPNPAEDPTWEIPRRRRRDDLPERRPVDPQAVTRALRDRPPSWEGEPPEPPRRARPVDPDTHTRVLPEDEDGNPKLF